jgi:hypothetical protein
MLECYFVLLEEAAQATNDGTKCINTLRKTIVACSVDSIMKQFLVWDIPLYIYYKNLILIQFWSNTTIHWSIVKENMIQLP